MKNRIVYKTGVNEDIVVIHRLLRDKICADLPPKVDPRIYNIICKRQLPSPQQ